VPLAYSADGKTLATVSGDGIVRLWDAATGKETRPLKGPEALIQAVAFSPDGQALALRDAIGKVRLWDTAADKELRAMDGGSPAAHLVFSPDGKTLTSGGNLWEVRTGRLVHKLRGAPPLCAAFSADGETLATGTADGLVFLWGAADGKEIRQYKPEPVAPQNPGGRGWRPNGVCAVAFAPDGQTLAAGEHEGLIRLWDLVTHEERRRFEEKGSPEQALAFSPDGKTLACRGPEQSIRLLEVATGKERGRFVAPGVGIEFLAFAPDGKTLASRNADKTAFIWDLTGRVRGGQVQPVKLLAEDLESLWAELAGADAAKAYRAVWTLAAAPQQVLPLLQKHLQPAAAIDGQRTARLIADLESDEFTTREKATAELVKLGRVAVPALRKVLTSQPSLETRRRVEQILTKLKEGAPPPEQLRALRAVEVLEHTGTAEARRLLATLAKGAPEAQLTQEAKASLERLAGRDAKTP
jgi:hypothetical protein